MVTATPESACLGGTITLSAKLLTVALAPPAARARPVSLCVVIVDPCIANVGQLPADCDLILSRAACKSYLAANKL